jgi:hypothetical protein
MKEFVIAGYARTGSTHLAMMLNSHPNVWCNGEIFNPKVNKNVIADPDVANPEKCLKATCCHSKKRITHLGFKIFHGHALFPPLSNIWDYIQKEKLPTILLTRRNLLNRCLSEMLAESYIGKVKHPWCNLIFKNPITINPKECIDNMHTHLGYEEILKETFSNNPTFHMAYEDLEPTPESYGKLLKFLGLDWHPPVVQLRKQRVKPQSQMITNYRELKEAICTPFSPFSHFFDEENLPVL